MREELWRSCVAFHGHECPGLAIGFRGYEVAARELGLSESTCEDLFCVCENDACGVDAVQLLSGCTVGKGNLLLRDRGKMAFSFFPRGWGEGIRVLYRRPLTPQAMDRRALQAHILTAPVKELFSWGVPSYPRPEKVRLFDSLTCAQCGEAAAESRTRLSKGQILCLDCSNDYQRGWGRCK